MSTLNEFPTSGCARVMSSVQCATSLGRSASATLRKLAPTGPRLMTADAFIGVKNAESTSLHGICLTAIAAAHPPSTGFAALLHFGGLPTSRTIHRSFWPLVVDAFIVKAHALHHGQSVFELIELLLRQYRSNRSITRVGTADAPHQTLRTSKPRNAFTRLRCSEPFFCAPPIHPSGGELPDPVAAGV